MKKFIAKLHYVLTLFILVLTVSNILAQTEKSNSKGSVSIFSGRGSIWEFEAM